MLMLVKELFFFFFNDTATTEIYTLSLHDALPICVRRRVSTMENDSTKDRFSRRGFIGIGSARSEEHTSELQSQSNLVCRLLLEKKKKDSIRWNLSSMSSYCSLYSVAHQSVRHLYH